MPSKKIVIDDAVPYAKDIFSHLGNIVTIPGRDICADDVADAHALIVRSRTQVNRDLLEASTIEFVGSTVVGLDHIDQNYLKQNNIHFYSAQGCNANSVAEFIINCLFELAEAFDFQIKDKTLAIIGVGNVGSRVFDKAKTLGIRCLLNDPPKIINNPSLEEQYPYHSLEECLKADIITVHTPLTQTGDFPTFDLINAQHLQQLQPSQILINAARGGIINEQEWIQTKTLANVIDCWENEPFINEELYKRAWLATPHIAGHSLDAKVAGSSMVYSALCQFWGEKENYDWQAKLPASESVIKVPYHHNQQTYLNRVFKTAHDIFKDDQGIRDKQITEVHKKYEYFRRNYPIYREWQHHNTLTSGNEFTDNTLKTLGFTLIDD